MRALRMPRVSSLLIAVGLLACAANSPPASPAAVTAPPEKSAPSAAPSAAPGTCITILATNDLHGTLEPQVNHAGEHSVRAGGVTTLSGYVKRLRDQLGGRVLLVDGGDMY